MEHIMGKNVRLLKDYYRFITEFSSHICKLINHLLFADEEVLPYGFDIRCDKPPCNHRVCTRG